MNKKILLFIFTLVLVTSALMLFFIFNTKDNISKDINNIVTTSAEEVYEYKDDNPIELGFYIYENGFKYVDKEIHLNWYKFKDLPTFNVLATKDRNINYWYMQDAFPHYWNMYKDSSKYKIGYNLTYETDEGIFSYNIINPEDRMQYVFNYMQMYTYDDVTPLKGAWYDHLDNNEIKDGVLMTSIKLCVSVFYDQIKSPMKLTAFTYDSEDDFDPNTHEYRGNSKITILIYKAN